MKYISISLYRKLVVCALAEGISEQVLRQFPTAHDALDGIQAVPADHFFELHEILERNLEPGFSIRVGQQMKIDDYGVLGLSWRTCSRAGEIFERSERYFKLLSNTYDFNVKKKDDISEIQLLREPHRRGLELSNEATLSATVVVLKATTETDISPIKVTFKHGPPKDLKSHREAFNCPILFNHSNYSISYRTLDLEAQTAKADYSINRFLLDRVEEETKGMVISSNKVVFDVGSLIRDALPSGIPGIIQISSHMGMSSRTLTRRLNEQGATFRDIIQKTQEHVAKELLINSDQSIAEIAFLSGFSEQSAFSRAFKRWTGLAPVEFRNK
ncbi:AraC-type DNA-binding protein [Cyclobacterium lianum]|uniref:AraC-type DNA-binding protein n=1 Tax=Cyclobacterium lianum TaxID=388280 RepID=A0A1M7JRT1_9BACT|nr:AraC family transcriptional regulator [Cyclobacterium lianum]SHM55605.1 AraC-type DNA-binding protein [Cyclobacterium lianum]